MSSKIFYCTKVVAYGILCIITKLEFFQHQFAKMGHGNTSCDPHLHPSHQATNAPLPHAKRPPHGRLRPNAVTVYVDFKFPIMRLTCSYSSGASMLRK